MSILKVSDLRILDEFFNNGGNVMDFSVGKFDNFTTKSVGTALCETYNLSKGKSLYKFFDTQPDYQVRKLLGDLIEYYDTYTLLYPDEQQDSQLYERVKHIYNTLQSSKAYIHHVKELKKSFDTDYMHQQIDVMMESIESKPSEAIGKAKELLESCCLTILQQQNISINKDWDIPRLSKEVIKLLKLAPADIPDGKRTSDTVKRILGNLSTIPVGLAELRNPHGSGHGKVASYKGLSSRHARLAVGASITVVEFIWETYQMQLEKGTLDQPE